MRRINRLNARAVATLDRPGRHADGGGLYLAISKHAAAERRRWVFLFRWRGKLKEMGLGSAASVSLAQARQVAAKWRAELAAGRDPFESREAERRAQTAVPTFEEVAADLHTAKSPGWRNSKVRKQWISPLQRYAAQLISMPVNEIDTEHVVTVLQPIWSAKPETASRVRSRIEAVIDAARARGLIAPNEANPARWRGHLSHLLPKRRKLTRGHHAAMAYRDVPAFVGRLRERESIAALALEFLILTAARTGEVLGASWGEIDTEARIWRVPAARTKGGREHRVPLTDRALEIIATMQHARTGELVFPSAKLGRDLRARRATTDRPLSGMAMQMLLRRMKVHGVTVHGFRSSFRDWAGDATHFPRELAEAALAHVAGDETERAYRRGDALERRRELMDAWTTFCGSGERENVVMPRVSQ